MTSFFAKNESANNKPSEAQNLLESINDAVVPTKRVWKEKFWRKTGMLPLILQQLKNQEQQF